MQVIRRALAGLGPIGLIALLSHCGTASPEETNPRVTLSSVNDWPTSPEASNPESPAACTLLENGACSGEDEQCCRIEASRFDFEANCWRPAGRSPNLAHGYGTLTCVPIDENGSGCRTRGAIVCYARMLEDDKPEVVRTSFIWKGAPDDYLPCNAPAFADFGLNALPSDICP